MDGHASQVDVVQQLVVELHRHTGGEEHHHLLVPVLLQEGEEQEEPFVARTHDISLFQPGHGGHALRVLQQGNIAVGYHNLWLN